MSSFFGMRRAYYRFFALFQLLVVVVFCFLSKEGGAQPFPRVVVSIPPLQAITAEIIGGVGELSLLIPGGESPHGAALNPSRAGLLAEANLVIWVGPNLETRLGKAIQTLAPSARVLRLTDDPTIGWLPARAAGHHHHEDDDDYDDHGDHGDHGDHDHDDHDEHGEDDHGDDAAVRLDPHAWLDVKRAAVMGGIIAAALSDTDPDHAALYQRNAIAFAEKMAVLDAKIADLLRPVARHGYITAHDAYQYAEKAYGLNGLGVVAVSPDRPAGAASLAALRQAIETKGAVCLFAETQFSPPLAKMLADEFGLRTAEINPLGTDTDLAVGGYGTMMNTLATTIARCLSGSGGE